MLRQTVNVFVASRPCIVYAMICYVCFRSPHHERNQFPEDVESPAFVYCDSTQDDKDVECPHMNPFYTRLVDNKHAHYYGTDI